MKRERAFLLKNKKVTLKMFHVSPWEKVTSKVFHASLREKVKINFSIPKILPNSKKASHIGIILSFTLFVFFLMFLFLMLQPAIKMQKEKTFILEQFETELIKNVSSDLTSLSMSVIASAPQNCIELEDLINETSSRIVVKNESYDFSEAYISNEDPNNLLINRSNSENRFFKIYSSEEFEELETLKIVPNMNLKKDEGYTINLIKTDNYVFEKKIIKLINDYDYNGENYIQMKNDFKIPQGNDFDFSFTCNNGTTIGNKDLNLSTNIYTKKVYVQYVDKNANILSGIINLKIW